MIIVIIVYTRSTLNDKIQVWFYIRRVLCVALILLVDIIGQGERSTKQNGCAARQNIKGIIDFGFSRLCSEYDCTTEIHLEEEFVVTVAALHFM